MQNTTRFLVAGAALAAAAVPAAAMAQGPYDPAGPLPFSGPRVEVFAGYDHHRSGSSVDNDTSRDLKQSIDGVTYGVGAGYDVNTGGGFVVGAEAEVSGSSAGWDNNNGVPNTFNLGRVKAGRDIYVGGRLGYATSPRTLVYLKGGYTNQRYNLLGSDGTTTLNQSIEAGGYRVGAGVEHQLSGNTYAKLEYRYSNYRKAKFDFGGAAPDSSRFNIDTDRHQVVVGAGVRF